MIPEKTYQEREPEYEDRDRSAGESGGGGACYCFNVFEDKRNPENNLVVDADRWVGGWLALACAGLFGAVGRPPSPLAPSLLPSFAWRGFCPSRPTGVVIPSLRSLLRPRGLGPWIGRSDRPDGARFLVG